MSDVNKLDNKQCPFDLSKYKSNDVVAPIGSLPWAIIQVYMGNTVARGEWETPDEYIALTVKNPDSASHIDKHDKYGSSNWQPTPGDLMACDWGLLKPVCPEGSMLIFDLKLGFEQIPAGYKWWGYNNWGSQSIHTGTLNIIQNKIGIIDIQWFYLRVGNTVPTLLSIDLQVSTDKNSDQKVSQIFNKNFYVTVDNETYDLGIHSSWGQNGLYTRNVSYTYDSRYDAHNPQKLNVKKLSEILKQTDQTKRFCLAWRDK
ncbi:conserved hypothetical protein [Xenorhabdus bovienii str. puntauvense]|uniref:Uncharacterized protein n=1 Tax=Xenorhabdus bovienii str. puntauvense TaxID=1398201 RepID=A0A077N241_XENBV|nr:MW1434 family type I TA system toxin [Xenorhabdus bovienii]CDG96176.1 conserved hypothetical protein [Xenorhabdus bovienii str. puntauvense]